MRITASILMALLAAACGREAPPESRPEGDYSERMAREHRADAPAASPAATASVAAPVKSETVTYATLASGPARGYLAYPAHAEGGLPAVLLFHEWWGLNDNIRAMANQLAGEGYVALAVDLYGGARADEPEAARRLMEAALDDAAALDQHLRLAQAFLREQVKATRVGTLGWCLGGGMSLRTAVLLGDQVDAAVVYYGHVNGDAAALKGLAAPVLGLFGGADEGVPVASVRAFEQALKSLGKAAEIHVYDCAAHAFANPSGGNYKADAATDAWARTLAFLAAHLKDS